MADTTARTDEAQLNRRKEQVALISIGVSALLMIAKAIAGVMTGSLALLSDAANSLVDVGATTLTWLAVREAHKPADEQHHYGHGKFESMSALAETAFLFLLSGIVAFEGIRRLASDESVVEPSWLAGAILLGAIVVDGWRWWTLKKVAKETGSEALEADALHFSSDLVNSIFVLIALGLTAMGFPAADALIAIGVSVYIAIAGFGLARKTISTLLDAAPRGVAEQVHAIVNAVPGVVSVAQVKVRPAGSVIMGEVGINVSRTLPLERVAALRAKIAGVLEQEIPRSEFTLTANPVQLDSETVLERVMLLAVKNHVLVHHVTVQQVKGQLSISLDMEVDGRMHLKDAHTIATRFEAALQDEFGPETEVETHLEPLEHDPLDGRDADAAEVEKVMAILQSGLENTQSLHNVHHLRVRETSCGLVVNYHCYARADLDVTTVHAEVDILERLLRNEYPQVARVVGHAEPAPATA